MHAAMVAKFSMSETEAENVWTKIGDKSII